MVIEMGLGIAPWGPPRGGVLRGKHQREDKGKHEAGRGARVTNYQAQGVQASAAGEKVAWRDLRAHTQGMSAALRTFGTLALPGTWHGQGGADALVGRLVANGEFLRALFRYSSFERFLFFAGEAADHLAVQEAFVSTGLVAGSRVEVRNLLELPASLAHGDPCVLHATSYVGAFLDLCWLRDRHASRCIPVTAQVHSLSYPSALQTFLRARVLPPSPADAIICTSERGKNALLAGHEMVAEGIANETGLAPAPLQCQLPVIALGVEVCELRSGDGAATRAKHGIPMNAIVVLSIGRFSEYDKQDLFPLLVSFRDAVAKAGDGPPLYLLLAGARQGSKTPEMVELWARVLGISDRLKLELNFPAAEKPNILAAADLFVAISDNPQETFGLSVVEAMAAGKAVIVSDYDGYRDTVPDGVGVRIPTLACDDLSFLRDLSPVLYERPLHLFLGQTVSVDGARLTNAIALLARDEPRRSQLSAAARQHAELFDWHKIILRLEEMWTGLTTNSFRKRPPTARHPLGLDFARMFAGYPTGALPENAQLKTTPLAKEMCQNELIHPIYPEQRNVVRAPDVLLVHRVVSGTPAGLQASQLLAAMREFLGSEHAWRASPTISWMLKHGLLAL